MRLKMATPIPAQAGWGSPGFTSPSTSVEYRIATLDRWMADELPQNLEQHVLSTIRGAFKSREVLNAERPDGVPPVTEDQTMLQGWASVVSRQGCSSRTSR